MRAQGQGAELDGSAQKARSGGPFAFLKPQTASQCQPGPSLDERPGTGARAEALSPVPPQTQISTATLGTAGRRACLAVCPAGEGSLMTRSSPIPSPSPRESTAMDPKTPPQLTNRRRLSGSARSSTQRVSSSALRPSGPLWTVEQVAQHCSVSSRTTRRWIEAGVLRAHRLGHVVRVSQEDLAAFLAAHRDL